MTEPRGRPTATRRRGRRRAPPGERRLRAPPSDALPATTPSRHRADDPAPAAPARGHRLRGVAAVVGGAIAIAVARWGRWPSSAGLLVVAAVTRLGRRPPRDPAQARRSRPRRGAVGRRASRPGRCGARPGRALALSRGPRAASSGSSTTSPRPSASLVPLEFALAAAVAWWRSRDDADARPGRLATLPPADRGGPPPHRRRRRRVVGRPPDARSCCRACGSSTSPGRRGSPRTRTAGSPGSSSGSSARTTRRPATST